MKLMTELHERAAAILGPIASTSRACFDLPGEVGDSKNHLYVPIIILYFFVLFESKGESLIERELFFVILHVMCLVTVPVFKVTLMFCAHRPVQSNEKVLTRVGD